MAGRPVGRPLAWERRANPHPHPSPNPHPKAFIWPSGYYAKTEFNITFDRNNNARLTGGRDQHLVTIDALLEANRAAAAAGNAEASIAYNEINFMVGARVRVRV